MLDKRIIEQVLAEQQLELANLSSKALCSRPEEQLVELDSDMAQVVIGVRRCGKSTLCYNVLKENGELFAYANFDDERFEEMTSKSSIPCLKSCIKCMVISSCCSWMRFRMSMGGICL